MVTEFLGDDVVNQSIICDADYSRPSSSPSSSRTACGAASPPRLSWRRLSPSGSPPCTREEGVCSRRVRGSPPVLAQEKMKMEMMMMRRRNEEEEEEEDQEEEEEIDVVTVEKRQAVNGATPARRRPGIRARSC
ncbi:hypothetical protein GBF38_000855 [Nibea albiflora]|nr:hypothetical protein GBF38_000855 [Nibea albiflora]